MKKPMKGTAVVKVTDGVGDLEKREPVVGLLRLLLESGIGIKPDRMPSRNVSGLIAGHHSG